MKKIKKILFLCLIFVLTGCSVEYNLTINEDGSISEKVVAEEITNRMQSNTRLKGDQAVNYLFNMFKRDDKNIKLLSKNDSTKTYATVTNSLNSLDEYKEKFTSDVFESVEVEKKDGIITLIFNQTGQLGGNSSRQLIYDDITANITVPYIVKEHNADDVSGDTYTWHIKKNEALKKIKIAYEDGNMKNSINLKINNKTYNISYGIIVISGIIVVLLAIVLVVYIKNKKNNVV